MAPYNSRCCEQRRAESPIRIQPRAAPWVKIFQQTCALKEQKEGERVSTSLAPVALTARQLVNELTPRVLPWAVFPLGLRPVLAYNHGCCTLRWVISLSGLRPVLARNHGCCNIRYYLCWLGELFAISEFGVFHDTSVSFRVIPLLRYKYFPLHDNTYFCGEGTCCVCPVILPKNGWLKSSK